MIRSIAGFAHWPALSRPLASIALIGCAAFAGQVDAAMLYSNDFETDTTGWSATTRVGSGTGGVPSSSGSFHAVAAAGTTFTQWGGYNFGAGSVPTAFQEYYTSIDVYLNLGAGFANNTLLDFSSAVSGSNGAFKRDFIFNAAFFGSSDNTGPGASTDRFVISASNNSQPGSAFAKNPARDPIAISISGWYTFEHHFYENAGVLAVDMSIFDASNVLINTWTLSDPTDLIAGVGGNRYGWFVNKGALVAFNNAELRVVDAVAVPEPLSLALVGLGLAAVRYTRRKAG